MSHIHAMLTLRIADTLRSLGISQAEAARRCGLSAQRFGHYVSGKRTPDLKTLVKISEALNTNPNALLGFSDQKQVANTEVLLKILILEGISAERSAHIVGVATSALELLGKFSQLDPSASPSEMAVHAAWLMSQARRS